MFKYLENKEKYFFYGALALITILYLLSGFNKYADGYIHLKSAEIIKYILTNTCPDAAKIFKLNPIIVPNWASASIMVTLLLLGIPSIIVHKITFCLAFIIIILGFRYLISKSKGNIILSWLGIGFAFNNIILAGTYNTAFALGLVFFSIGYYEENKNNIQSIKFNIIFCILITCTWFSHFLIYFIGGVIIFLYELFDLTQHVKRLGFNFSNIYTFIRSRLLLLICYLPSLILSANYLLSDREVFNLINKQDKIEYLASQFFNIITMLDLLIVLPDKLIIFNYLLTSLYFVFFICFFTLSYLYPDKSKKVYGHPIFLSLIFVIILSFVISNGIGGAWELGWRLRIIAWYLMFFLFSYYTKKNIIISSFIITISLLICSVNILFLFQHTSYESKLKNNILNNISKIDNQSNIYSFVLDTTLNLPQVYESLAKNKNCIIEVNNYHSYYDAFPITGIIKNIKLPSVYPIYDKNNSAQFLALNMVDTNNLTLYSSTAKIDINYIFVWGDSVRINTAHSNIQNSYIRKNKAAFERNFYGYLEKNMQLIHSYKDKNGKYFLRIYKRLPQ